MYPLCFLFSFSFLISIMQLHKYESCYVYWCIRCSNGFTYVAFQISVTYLRLDGSVEPEKRFDIVKTFNSDPTIDALLLTTHGKFYLPFLLTLRFH